MIVSIQTRRLGLILIFCQRVVGDPAPAKNRFACQGMWSAQRAVETRSYLRCQATIACLIFPFPVVSSLSFSTIATFSITGLDMTILRYIKKLALNPPKEREEQT